MDGVLDVLRVINYCKRFNLCTGMDIKQYDVMLDMVTRNRYSKTYVHDIALLIWFCSVTMKDVQEIERDLKEYAGHVE